MEWLDEMFETPQEPGLVSPVQREAQFIANHFTPGPDFSYVQAADLWRQAVEKLREAVKGRPEQATWAAQIFEQLAQWVTAPPVDRFVREALRRIARERLAEVVDSFHLLREPAEPEKQVGFLLRAEGIAFAPLFAKIASGDPAFEARFAGVVETHEELEGILEVFATVPEIHAILKNRILVAEDQLGTTSQERYDQALAATGRMLDRLSVTEVREQEPDLLAQLKKLLAAAGYRLPTDLSVQDAALTLLRAA